MGGRGARRGVVLCLPAENSFNQFIIIGVVDNEQISVICMTKAEWSTPGPSSRQDLKGHRREICESSESHPRRALFEQCNETLTNIFALLVFAFDA